jgi:hypothetical protein
MTAIESSGASGSAEHVALRNQLAQNDDLRATEVLSRPGALIGLTPFLALVFLLAGLLYAPAALALAATERPIDVLSVQEVARLVRDGGFGYVKIAALGAALSLGPPILALAAGERIRLVPEVLLGGPMMTAYRFGQLGVVDALVIALLFVLGTSYASGVIGAMMGRLTRSSSGSTGTS